MAQRRPDKAYILQRILELYSKYTVEQIVDILNKDPQVVTQVTLSSLRNDINRLRKQGKLEHKDKPWTKADHDLMVSLYNASVDIPNIAEQLGRSIPAIHARISQQGLANREITDEQVELVTTLLTTTQKSLVEIGIELGIDYQAVRHVWDKLRKEHGIQEDKRSTTVRADGPEGSISERLLRKRLTEIYGGAVLSIYEKRTWSGPKNYEIDIPIVVSETQKYAVEVNHFRVHAYRRNIDYAKRKFAESLRWVWIPIWLEGPATYEWLESAVDTVKLIVAEHGRGESVYYDNYMQQVAEQEKKFYLPDQPVYDPKEGVPFGDLWSADDVDIMLKHYATKSIEEIQELLSKPRTPNAIIHKARQLGVRKDRGYYSLEEDEIIQKHFSSSSRTELLEMLPGRTWASISARAKHLGVERSSNVDRHLPGEVIQDEPPTDEQPGQHDQL